MRKIFSDIVCNERQKDVIARHIAFDKNSHAYIISGPAGSGKKTFAKLIAAALECEHKHDDAYPLPCKKCNSCDKILFENAVDVTYIKRPDSKAFIQVDQIRELQKEVYISSTEQQNKIYIIEEAHLMNEQSQNAFLKILEEPPKNVVFLLLSENNEALLETIKSRAQSFSLDPVPADKMREYLVTNSKKAAALNAGDPDALAEIIASSDGSIGTALAYLDAKAQKNLLAKRSIVKDFISLLAAKRDRSALFEFLTSIPQKRDDLVEFFTLATLALRDLAVCKKSTNAPTCFYGTRKEAESASELFSISGIFCILDSVSVAKSSLEESANISVTLANLFCELQKR